MAIYLFKLIDHPPPKGLRAGNNKGLKTGHILTNIELKLRLKFPPTQKEARQYRIWIKIVEDAILDFL